MRDTIVKYIPTAYKDTVDNSGNKHSFSWKNNNFQNDTIRVKVYYAYDETGNSTKEWEGNFTLK